MRGLRVLSAALATAASVVACDPITHENLYCPTGGCPDASVAPDAAASWDAAPQPGQDAAQTGLDAAQPGPDATASADASVPTDASSSGDASCARLYNLGYPGGALIDKACLRDIPRFKTGPCAGGGDCHLDSRSFYELPDGGLVESVTSGGKLWEYDGRSGAVLTGGVDLSHLSHLSTAVTGACAGKPDFGCTLDSRTYRPESGGGWTEAVTSNGQMFNYDAFTHAPRNTPATNGALLTGLPRYSVGSGAPCYGLTSDQCRFQTQAYSSSGTSHWEWVTRDGTLFILDAASTAGAPQNGSGTKLSQVQRFQSTVCAGVTDCRLRTHAFVAAPDGGIVESFSD